MKVRTIDKLNDLELSQVISLFFETSTIKEFATIEAKEFFLYRYFGYYQENFPDTFLIAFNDDESTGPLGYLCGHDHTFEDDALKKLQVALEYFEEMKKSYPAHLHINVSSRFRGKGVGRLLLSKFDEILLERNICGVHIITAPSAQNRHFYTQNGFDFKLVKKVNNAELLLMGKSIKSNS